MRLGTCLHTGRMHLCVAAGDEVVVPALSGRPEHANLELLDIIRGGGAALEQLSRTVDQSADEARLPISQVSLLAPIPRPSKNIMCLGWNYSEHIQETSAASNREAKLPEHPIVFTKAPTSVIGTGASIPYDPDISAEIDWEVELGVVIGTGGKGIDRDDAIAHIFGYTVINDISARDLQFRHKQFFIGKSLDGACPMGPWIVTADEIEDPQNLRLSCSVNGVVKQDSNTEHMIFDIPTIIATLSRGMSLEPGDIIATGTPDGVGFARKPPEFLAPGDEVTCEIQGIGAITNRIS